MKSIFFLSCAVLLFTINPITVFGINIYSVSTHPYTENYNSYGSMKGGTLIYIKGGIFDVFPSNNYVLIGSKLCEVEYAQEQILHCYTPPLESIEDQVKLTVQMLNSNGEVISVCKQGDCSFTYKKSVTPEVQGMYPRTVSPLDTLHITGAYQLTSSDQYKYIKFYDKICKATNLGSLDYAASTQTVDCQVAESTPPGLYNGSFLVSTGAADVSMPGITVDGNQVFDVRVVAEITEINENYASKIGKKVKIQGLGFGDHQELVEVSLQGTPCQVTSATRTNIECDMPEIAPLEGSQFKGAIGLKLKQYTVTGSISPSELRASVIGQTASLKKEEALVEFETLLSSEINYAARAYGYFRAARTGDYKFYISCKGACELYFQESNDILDQESMTLIASAQDTTKRYYFQQETQISQTLTLTEGNMYYIEAYHTKQSTGAELTVSVEIPSSEFRVNSIIEKVLISIDSELELEKFFIKIYGQTGGTWKILYQDYANLQVSDALPWNATCAQVATSINKFGTTVTCEIGEVDADGNLIVETVPVEGEEPIIQVASGWIYNITFTKRRDTEIKLVALTTTLTTETSLISVSNWWNHVSAPVSGTFTLALDQALTQIMFNASIADIKAAFINDLFLPDTIEVKQDSGNVKDGLKWQIIFTGYQGDVPELILSAVNLAGGKTGTVPTLTVTTQVNGSLNQLYEPIPADILLNAEINPQLIVTVNGTKSACSDNCDYIIDESITPAIDSFQVTQTGLTITLSNFAHFSSLTTNDFIITFAGSSCVPSSVSLPTIICMIAQNTDGTLKLSAGSNVPQIEINNFGKLDASALTAYEVAITVSAVSPSAGSPNGGQQIVITGSGFGQGIQIKLGSITAYHVISIENTQITIMTPHSDASQNSTLSLTLNGKSTTSTVYTFTTTGLPTITSLSKSTASPMIKSHVVVNGTGFGTDPSVFRCILQNVNDESKYFELNVYSAEANGIMCILGGGIQGSYQLNVIKQSIGYALVQPEGANLFKFEISITDFYPKNMGIYAGSKLTIIGVGFSEAASQNQITIGEPNIYCKIVSATSTQLVCELNQDVTESYLLEPQDFHLLQRVSESAQCKVEGGCQLTFIEPYLDCFEIISE